MAEVGRTNDRGCEMTLCENVNGLMSWLCTGFKRRSVTYGFLTSILLQSNEKQSLAESFQACFWSFL
jgi:hypothetical protein